MTDKKYISEVIGEEYKEWKKGDMILIKSPTGSGKSEFIKKQLLSWCKGKNKKLLLLSNRTLLYKQQINDIQAENINDNEQIELSLYQKFDGAVNEYDYVVCDECHYFYEDSSFNRETDIILKEIENKRKDIVTILLSATPDLIEKRFKKYIIKKYSLPFSINNYSLYKYWNKKSVPIIIKDIIKKYPNDKIMYFTSSADNAYKMSLLFDDSAFICSKTNSNFSNLSSNTERTNIQENSKYDCKLLCATTALDNGINIKDSSVKHLILDVFTPISTIQCLGRKRLEDTNEHINIYLRDCGKNYLTNKITQCEKSLKPYIDYSTMSKEEFAKEYHKKNIGRILDLDCCEREFNYQVNECMRDWYLYIKEFCEMCINIKGYYFVSLCTRMGLDSMLAEDILEDIEYEKLEFVMEKWLGKKIFDIGENSDKEKFVSDVFEVVEARSIDGRLKGISTINNIISSLNLKYIIESKSENSRKSDNRGRHYWIVKCR